MDESQTPTTFSPAQELLEGSSPELQSSHSLPSAHGSPGSTPAVVEGMIAIQYASEFAGCSTITPEL